MGVYVFILVLILVTSVLLTLVVLVQNSKGGGLASNFAGSNQIMGVRKTADFLEKATWSLAIALVVLSLMAVIAIPDEGTGGAIDTELRDQIENTSPIPSNMVPPTQDNQ
jgi:preprotein translocase subunit SecG